MTAIVSERIGVVVVHGVGDTVEGWIDSDLVPQFEKWRAYASIGALDRKEEGFAQFFCIRAEDRYLAVGLSDNDDFRSFCRIAGLEALLSDDKFKTGDARTDNRALLSANGLALLVFGMLPQPLLGLCVVALAHSGLL